MDVSEWKLGKKEGDGKFVKGEGGGGVDGVRWSVESGFRKGGGRKDGRIKMEMERKEEKGKLEKEEKPGVT